MKRMKILLLEHPRAVNLERCNDIANTPLSSCLLSGYIAAMLERKGYEVEIVEGYLDKLTYAEVAHQIKVMQPDLLGVHMIYHWDKDVQLYALLEKVRKEGLASYITAYGFYPSFAFEDILKECSALDSIVLGEPELTMLELAEVLGQNKPTRDLLGLAQRVGGKISHQRRQPMDDLDLLPFPKRTEASYSIGEVNLAGSRGCYGQCTFCYINPFYGSGAGWRGRSPENIVAEIDEIIANRGLKYFYFTDPNFFGPGQRGQERAMRLASLLKPRQIQFGIEARVNDIHDEVIGVLVDAGLSHLLIGLESGKDESLRRMNKMTTVAQNERALQILRKHGLEPNVGFIMFEPDSTLKDIRTNFEFLQRNDLLKRLEITVNVLYHHQIILKGTTAYRNLEKEERLEMHPSSNYEATTAYQDQQVATLAYIMRRITNHIFSRLENIWSGKVQALKDAQSRYAKINQLLIKGFENVLKELEAGKSFSAEDKEAYIAEIIKTMDQKPSLL